MVKKRVRRVWGAEEKRLICLQTLGPSVSVAQVARRYRKNANLIFRWLKDPRFRPNENHNGQAKFLPVEVTSEPEAGLSTLPQSAPVRQSCWRSGARVEIATADGDRVSVAGSFDGDALALLLKGLVT